MTIQVTFQGVKLSVEYDYCPAQLQTYDDPGFDEAFEVIGVHTPKGDDIFGLFEDSDFGQSLEDCVAEAHRDRYVEDYPEYEREDD